MTSRVPSGGTARRAVDRLRADQAAAPLAEQRARLAIAAERLQRAARSALTQHLAGRVRSDGRFAPLLGSLMRMALDR